MKRASRILPMLAMLAACAHAQAQQRPTVDALFDAMAISVPAGQQSRYVVGDNLTGYFEGFTHASARGAGYMIGNESVFLGYQSGAHARAAAAEQVLPYGHRTTYPDGATEEMALLSKQRAIAIRIGGNGAAPLTVKPLLPAFGAATRSGAVLVLPPAPGKTMYCAIAAAPSASIDDTGMVSSGHGARSLTVILAFAPSAEQARQRAAALVAGDAIGTERRQRHQALTRSMLVTSDADYNKALNWAKAASAMFVVEEFGTGIWAGLPWFRDNWGRDTFIALPGTLLVSGQFDQARAVLANFARYQNLRSPREKEYGRIPNRVAAGDSIIYNTVDGTPWMLREAMEYIQYTGDRAFAADMYRLAVPYFDGAIANYVDQDGLLAHDSADTWMDARIENKQPWSARGPRAVEIQALWYTALRSGAELADQAGDRTRAAQWRALAERARNSFLRLYWDGSTMADRLRDDGSGDTKVRPNQLMLVSIPFDDFVAPAVQARVTRNAVSALLYPYGIASLSQDDPYFHPRHENPDYHHKDAAYHQGTIWGWNAGFTVTALNRFGYQDLAWALTQNLGGQILGLDTLGNMSELLDALPREGGALKPSGTYAQSWSVAEYARNGYQDYVGFHPNLLTNTLAFHPAIPAAWTHFDAILPFGSGEELRVRFRQRGARQQWTMQLRGGPARRIAFDFLNADKSRSRTAFTLLPGRAQTLSLAAGRARLAGKALAVQPVQASFAATIGNLHFVTPRAYRPQDFPMLREKDALKHLIEGNAYQ